MLDIGPFTCFGGKPSENYSSVELTWEGLTLSVGGILERGISTRKKLLDNVSGYCRSSSMLAIMGSSGSGKSTLLNSLSGNVPQGAVLDGDVCINGQNLGVDRSNLISYVQQEDLFIDNLTTRETLEFQANMKLRHLSPQERRKRVDEMIEYGKLTKVANTIIGSPISGNRGLSGGERKRLSLCMEVILGKPLIFADEPTSGLDASMAESICLFLKQLAASKRNVVVTIHQPSSDVFSLFDNILLLHNGQTAYLGSRTNAPAFFRSVGYICPRDFNPADFYIKVLAKDIMPGSNDTPTEKMETNVDLEHGINEEECLLSKAEANDAEDKDGNKEKQFERQSEESEAGDAKKPETKKFLASPTSVTFTPHDTIKFGEHVNIAEAYEKSQLKASADEMIDYLKNCIDFDGMRVPAVTKIRTQIISEFRNLIWRNSKILIRNPTLGYLRVLQHLFLAALCSMAFFQIDHDQERDATGILFLMVMVLSLLAVFNNIQVMPQELPLFLREYRSGTYTVASWYICKLIVEIPASIVLPFFFNVIVYFAVFQDPQPAKFVHVWITTTLASISGSATACFVSVVGWDSMKALAIAPAIYAPQFIFSGQFILIKNTKAFIRIVQILSMVRYVYEGAIVSYFGDYGGKTNAKNGKATISLLTMEEDALWGKDIPALGGIALVYHFLAFIILFLRARHNV